MIVGGGIAHRTLWPAMWMENSSAPNIKLCAPSAVNIIASSTHAPATSAISQHVQVV